MYDRVGVIGGSTDHAFQQIYALPPSSGMIPSQLINLPAGQQPIDGYGGYL